MRHRLALPLVGLLVALAAAPVSAQRLRVFQQKKGVLEFSGQMIVKPYSVPELENQLGDPYQADRLRQLAESAVRKQTVRYYPEVDEYVVRIPFGFDENSYQAYLMNTGAFKYVSPNYICYPTLTPNDPQYGSQWHLAKIEAPRCWDNYTGSATVTVAITDTGCDLTHQDLAGIYVSGYNSVTHLAQSAGGLVTPVHPHGTHCAGIVGAIGNNAVGVSGVAWNIKVMPVRVSDVSSGSASYAALTEGARWAVDHGAKVISTSYSGVDDPTIETTGQYIRARGGLYFYAAGNDNRNLSGFDHADVIVVGATDSADAKASFSAYGLGVDVYAPGVGILSTTPGNAYQSWDGTSMATPCAAACGAMIFVANPSLTPAQAEGFLFSGAQDLGPAGNDTQWGWGRVNVFRSVAQAVSQVRYYGGTGHYYERVTNPVTWAQAQTGAAARSAYGVSGHLAVVNSSGENSFIVNNLDTNFTRNCWLGGYQPGGSVEPAGGWSWVNGDSFSFSNWNPGEPNNGGGTEDRIEYWINGTLGGWNDSAAGVVDSGYIVEYPVPPPSTLSGTMTLSDYTGVVAGTPVVVEIKQGGVVKGSYATTLDAAGFWSIQTPWVGSFDIFVKADHWLKKFWGTRALNTTTVSGINTNGFNGDVDGDNGNDIGDYAILSSSYNKFLGDPGYVADADLNGDDAVDIGDFAILSSHYGAIGDE